MTDAWTPLPGNRVAGASVYRFSVLGLHGENSTAQMARAFDHAEGTPYTLELRPGERIEYRVGKGALELRVTAGGAEIPGPRLSLALVGSAAETRDALASAALRDARPHPSAESPRAHLLDYHTLRDEHTMLRTARSQGRSEIRTGWQEIATTRAATDLTLPAAPGETPHRIALQPGDSLHLRGSDGAVQLRVESAAGAREFPLPPATDLRQFTAGLGDGLTVHPHAPARMAHIGRVRGRGGVIGGIITGVVAGAVALVDGQSPANAATTAATSALASIPYVGGYMAPNGSEKEMRNIEDTYAVATAPLGGIGGIIAGEINRPFARHILGDTNVEPSAIEQAVRAVSGMFETAPPLAPYAADAATAGQALAQHGSTLALAGYDAKTPLPTATAPAETPTPKR